MKVLSLFDGISCGYLALQRAGIPIETYYASEIDKTCIKVSQKHFPNIIQLGDVNNFGNVFDRLKNDKSKAIYTHDGSIQLFYIQGKRVDKEEWDKLHRS